MEVEPTSASGRMLNTTKQKTVRQTRTQLKTKRQRSVMKIRKIVITTLALAATTTVLRAADATENWNKSCKVCHGEDGKGQTTMGKKLNLKDFTDAAYQATLTDAQATKTIKEGFKKGDSMVMKAFSDLSDDEIKALVAKVRAFKK
jgi:cytochrome c553